MKSLGSQSLPFEGMVGAQHRLRPAGSTCQQRALHKGAFDQLETYTTPSGLPGTRLSNDVLGSRGWRVQLAPHYPLLHHERTWLDPLALACSNAGMTSLLGAAVNPRDEPASSVWELGLDPDNIALFFNLHPHNFHMAFDANYSCALMANDGDYVAYAGPETWLRAALPKHAIGAAATADWLEGVEDEHGAGCMDSILEHYAPFMLDDD